VSPPASPPLAGLVCRQLQLSDEREAAVLIAAFERHFFGRTITRAVDLMARWRRPGFELGSNSLGYFDGETPVAFGELGSSADLLIHVSPERFGQGLASDLAEWGEAVARRHGFSSLRQLTPASDTVGAAALLERRYVRGNTTWVLSYDASTAAEVEPADGVVVRAQRTDERAATDRLLEEHSGDLSVRRPPDLGGRLLAPVYDPWESSSEDVQVAVAGGEVVGACVVDDAGSGCWIRQLAVEPGRQGRGIAAMLLVATLRAAEHRGREQISMSIAAGPHMPSLHGRAGIDVVAELWAWERPLFLR
jgi:mycothiol synthase